MTHAHQMKALRDKAKRVSLDCACTRIRQTSRAVTGLYGRAMAKTGLTQSQFAVLVAACLGGERGLSMSQCAKVLVLDRTSLTRVLKPLVREGLLRSEAGETDGRTKLLRLSSRGAQRLAKAFELWERAQAEFEAMVGPEGWRSLSGSLGNVLRSLA
jgi:DNA-binding MarR family transcriptional regulator